MKLKAREKSSLFFEGVITVILLLLLNLSIVVLAEEAIRNNPGLENGIFIIKKSLIIGPFHKQIWSYQRWLVGFMILIDVWVVYWRLIRRYRQYQMHHIIDELHYIAQGHFDHRIPFQLKGDQQHVVTSVNSLVDSAIQSMDDERKIEQSKDELITNVSHDLRTPLTSIIGYLGLIEDKQYHSSEDLLKYTHTAYEKAKQMKALVEDLFEYTKVRQTEAPVNIINVNLDQMLEQLAASFELEASKKDIKMLSNTKPVDLMIEADAEKLGRVFSNLIANGLKYGQGATYIKLEARQKDDKVIVRVSNDGAPIPQKALEHLFERFYRVEESRSKATGGTGLGLAIVQSIVDLHYGSVHAESNDKETSFVVELPMQREPVTKEKK
ncbi:sensor histidine kinase [Paucilactobacillus wasatchensis]|uniref:histidine kinase n=1 Tax=Paucilactobacillus wasatchensis TaxID=1335616 RepID=A0A0D0YYN4_9LACO|nr:HAMP domain-containing sensor histidine kinase [Paucilactobacillus wasatchensis]KIS04334.1 sensor histidine kinase [Paucilactobacillus wasatchensis]